MKALLTLFVLVVSVSFLSAQDTKTLTGRIISEDLELLPGVAIYDMDTTTLGSTYLEGHFEIEVPIETKELLLGLLGMEWTSVKIEDSCKTLEMIMMYDVIYDFMPIKKINKKRCKRFKDLPKKHLEAFEQGIFTTRVPCVSYIFVEH